MTSTNERLLTPEELRSRGMTFFRKFDAAYREKCISVAVRLQQAYSSMPWHAQRAAADPDYWLKFSTGRPNW